MKKVILPLISLTLILSSCGGSGSGASASPASIEIPKTPEELKMELAAHEKAEPLTYLTVDATMREDQVMTREEGLFHSAEYSPDGNTIHGTITNTATIAKFKDVVLIVTFYSQTDTPIDSQEFTFYEFYGPNTTNNYELKVYPPEQMAKFGIEIKKATPVD